MNTVEYHQVAVSKRTLHMPSQSYQKGRTMLCIKHINKSSLSFLSQDPLRLPRKIHFWTDQKAAWISQSRSAAERQTGASIAVRQGDPRALGARAEPSLEKSRPCTCLARGHTSWERLAWLQQLMLSSCHERSGLPWEVKPRIVRYCSAGSSGPQRGLFWEGMRSLQHPGNGGWSTGW